MQRSDRESKEFSDQRESEERNCSEWDCSEGCEIDEGVVSDQKVDDLHGSLERLREFVGGLPEEQVRTVPACVEEYCDKLRDYKVEHKESVILIAQRRLNKMLRNRKIKRNWNSEDISLLVWLVSKRLELQSFSHFSEFQKEDWQFISNIISGSTWQKCKFRWLSLKKVKLVTHKWSKNQSKLLSDIIAQNSKVNWKLVSEKLYEQNTSKNKVFRTAKQCREHWNCFLNPTIQKGPWTIQEDRRLLQYVLELEGSKKWSEISKFMEGRTQNALKNRFNLLMNRQRKVSGHLTQKRLVKICLNKLMLQEGQEQQLQMPSPLAMDLIEDREEVQREVSTLVRTPIVPTVIEQMHSGSHESSLGGGFGNFFGYLQPNIGMRSGNPVLIGFVIPNQFL